MNRIRSTKLEVMRRNRRLLAARREPLLDRINRLEREMVKDWGEGFLDSVIERNAVHREALLPKRKPSLLHWLSVFGVRSAT